MLAAGKFCFSSYLFGNAGVKWFFLSSPIRIGNCCRLINRFLLGLSILRVEHWGSRLLLPSVLAIALLLRVLALRSLGFYQDEASTWFYSGLSTSDIWFASSRLDANPPGFYLIESVFRSHGCSTPLCLEITPIFASVLGVYLCFLLAFRVSSDRRVGCLAAVLCAVDPLALFESVDARAYAVSFDFSALIVLSAFGLRDVPCFKRSILLGTLVGVGSYFHYSVIVLSLVALSVIVMSRPIRSVFLFFSMSGAIALVLYSPWIPSLIRHHIVGYPNLSSRGDFSDSVIRLLGAIAGILPLRPLQIFPGFAVVLLFFLVCIFVGNRVASKYRDVGVMSIVVLVFETVMTLDMVLGGKYSFVVVPLMLVLVSTNIFVLWVNLGAFRDLRRSSCVGFLMLCFIAAYQAESVLSLPKSGGYVLGLPGFVPSGALVVSAPDSFGPEVAYDLGERSDVIIDAYRRGSCPSWFRFSDEYENLWSSDAFRVNALSRLRREIAGRESVWVLQPLFMDVGRLKWSDSRSAFEEFRRARSVLSDHVFLGSFERVRIVILAADHRPVINALQPCGSVGKLLFPSK